MENSSNDAKTNLIINYLPQTLSDADFHNLFAGAGNVTSARIIRDKKSGYSFGYGFVDYATPQDAANAIEMLNGHKLQHKTIKVAYSQPSGHQTKNINLYVSGLKPHTNESELKLRFDPFGIVVQARILKDKNTDMCQGIGFVLFSSRAEANYAVNSLNGQKFMPDCQEVMTVKFARNEQKPPPENFKSFQDIVMSGNYGDDYGVGGGGRGNKAGGPMRGRGFKSNRGGRFTPMGGNGYQNNNMGYNNNYPGFGFNNMPFPPNYPPNFPGGSFNNFGNNYPGNNYPGNNYPGNNYPGNNYPGFGGQEGYQPNKFPTSYPLRQEFHPNNNNNFAGDKNSGESIVFVYGIGANCLEEELSEMFSSFGKIIRVNVIFDHAKAAGKGYGFVTFSNIGEATEAVNKMNNTPYNGKLLQVSFKS